MTRLDGHRLGMLSLRLDAAYCLVLGVLVAAAAPSIVTVIALPVPLLVTTGCVVAAWAGLVTLMASRLRMRVTLALVMAVNILAVALVAAASVTATTTLVTLVVIAVALEVAAFAASQAVAIRALRPETRTAQLSPASPPRAADA